MSVRTTPVTVPTVEPGESELSRAQTEALPLPAEEVVERRSWKRRAVLLSALAGVIVATAVLFVALGEGESGSRAAVLAAGDSLALVDARSGRLVASTDVGAAPTAVAAGEGAYSVTSADRHTVSRIDPATNAVVDTIPVGNGPSGITTGAGAVWVINSLDATVSRIDPGTNTGPEDSRRGRAARDRLRGRLGLGREHGRRNDHEDRREERQADRSNPDRRDRARLRRRHAVGEPACRGPGGSHRSDDREAGLRPDPRRERPDGDRLGHGAAWVANRLDGTVSRIDPETNSVTATVLTGNGPDAVAVDPGGIWVSNQFGGNVVRIDPGSNRVAQRVSVGSRVSGLAISGDAVLVAVLTRAPATGGRWCCGVTGLKRRATPTPSTRSTTRFRITRTSTHSCG